VNPVWVGLGSNIGQSRRVLGRALAQTEALPDTRVDAVSPCYRTTPWGVTEQPDFLNAVVRLTTELEPLPLLHRLQSIERCLGRRDDRPRWGPREIDLDILIYADRVVSLPELTVPHPHLAQRAFVLVPLNDLSPTLEVPGQGRVEGLLASLDPDERAGVHAADPIPRAHYHANEQVDRPQ
jgi:2-amino-4-hydroxy-6-hydroxymethyldihydropteridine diphosphokinase